MIHVDIYYNVLCCTVLQRPILNTRHALSIFSQKISKKGVKIVWKTQYIYCVLGVKWLLDYERNIVYTTGTYLGIE